MLTGRRTKLAIAVAILIIGVGAAFLFRRDEPVQTRKASKKTTPSAVAERSAGTPKAKSAATSEPSFSGHIEPYGWKDRPSDVGHQTATFPPPGAAKTPSATSPAPRDRTAAERPASYALSPGSQRMPTDNSPERPPFEIPARSASPAQSERNPTVFDRFATHPPPTSAMAAGKRHKIIDGDSLPAIAKRYLGAAERYLDLFEHNRDVLSNPELLPIGKELRIPPPNFVRAMESPSESRSSNLTAVAPPVAASSDIHRTPERPSNQPMLAASNRAAQQTYVVQAHDTLGLIARKIYGDIARQSELLAANRQQLRTPQDLRPGMTLIVPGARKAE